MGVLTSYLERLREMQMFGNRRDGLFVFQGFGCAAILSGIMDMDGAVKSEF